MDITRQNIKFLSDMTNNILDWAFEFPGLFITSSFGINGTVLLDFIDKKEHKYIPIYFINTGYHFPETLEIKEHYKKNGFNIS